MGTYAAVKHHYLENVGELSKQAFILAWMQLHINNPGMHPDDYLLSCGPYSGWHVLLAVKMHAELDTSETVQDNVMYPADLLQFSATLDTLAQFHSVDDDELYQQKILAINNFLKDMTTEALPTVVKDLEDLVVFHDGAPEEVYENLCTVCEMFHWIAAL